MTKKETINRNIGLAFDFLKEINNNPAILAKVPNGSVIEFVEKDFPKKEKKKMPGQKRKYIRVKNEFEIN
jgi:hypothetical protein